MKRFEEHVWETQLADLYEHGMALKKQESSVINLIASDNAMPRFFTENPPYAGYMIQEGLLNKRPFAGAALHDRIETIAAHTACQVFQAEHANLQPHSCSQANQAVYHALLAQGDVVLALGFKAGGHLTHGLKLNFSGRIYQFVFYGLGEDGRIDYDQAAKLAKIHKPKLIVCGSSAYPRLFDAARLREIANDVGALLMFDLSHEAGLIAGRVIPNPIPLADVATMSLDKTLRGPFGGTILCRAIWKDAIDRAVHPGTQSSFSVRKISDAAHALILTQGSAFKTYAQHVLLNAKAMEATFQAYPRLLLSGGTDKHYVILNVQSEFGITGEAAELLLEEIGILTSRQTLPSDESAKMSSAGGLRLGTAWATSRGYRAEAFRQVAALIITALSKQSSKAILADQVKALAKEARAEDVWSS